MIEILLAMLASAPQRDVEAARPEIVTERLTPIGDAALLDFVRRPFDPMSDPTGWRRTLGTHHGVPVIVSYVCSDLCPDYTKRIVRYNVLPGPDCERAAGISKAILVPRGIGVGLRRYCIPSMTHPYQR